MFSGSVDLVQNICDPKITCYFLAQVVKLRDKALDDYHVTVLTSFTSCLKSTYNMALVACTFGVVFTSVCPCCLVSCVKHTASAHILTV